MAPNYYENGTAFTSFLIYYCAESSSGPQICRQRIGYFIGLRASPALGTVNAGGGFAGSNGWRLPTLEELQTIVLDFPCTAASCECPSSPCIDPALDASTTKSEYWTARSYIGHPLYAWSVFFYDGEVVVRAKTDFGYVRAVRGGL